MSIENYINESIKSFFKENNTHFNSLKKANNFLQNHCGIINFFTLEKELNDIKNIIEIQFDTKKLNKVLYE